MPINQKELRNKTLEIFGKIVLIIAYPIITILTTVVYCFIRMWVDIYKIIKDIKKGVK